MSNDDETAAMRARAEAFMGSRPPTDKLGKIITDFAAAEVARALAEERAKVSAGRVMQIGPLASTGMASAGPPAGLYRKFTVERSDGSSAPGMKHEYCEYFVLDWEHDKFAVPAALAYAKACEREFPALASDLRDRAGAAVARTTPALTEPLNPAPNLSPGLKSDAEFKAAVAAGARAARMGGQGDRTPAAARMGQSTEVPAADRAALMADTVEPSVFDKALAGANSAMSAVGTQRAGKLVTEGARSYEAAGNVPAPATTGPTAEKCHVSWCGISCPGDEHVPGCWAAGDGNCYHSEECADAARRAGVGPGPEAKCSICHERPCSQFCSAQHFPIWTGGRTIEAVLSDKVGHGPEGAPAAPALEKANVHTCAAYGRTDGACGDCGETMPRALASLALEVAIFECERNDLKARVAELEAEKAAAVLAERRRGSAWFTWWTNGSPTMERLIRYEQGIARGEAAPR